MHGLNCRVAAAALAILGGACQTSPVGATGVAGEKATSKAPGWVFHHGAYMWGDDYSYSAKSSYTDREGGAANGANDIKITLLGKWGGFQPAARNWDFDATPYAYLTFALKPTVPGQALKLYFEKIHDLPVGTAVDPLKYGPKPVPGRWATYTIPLADLGVAGLHIYKFAIQDQTGLAENTFYLDEIGFLPGP